MSAHPPFAAALLIAVSAVAHAQDSTLRIPLRVHLLSSPESEAVTTTRTERDVEVMLEVANRIWAQAGITWVLESVVREEAPQGARFDSVVTGRLPPTRERLFSVAPRGALLTPGWNLFLIRDFGQIGGGVFYVDIPGVVLAQRSMGIELAPGERGGATLAHELGHSLGLEHQTCDESRNIMANRCWSPTMLSALTAEQIALARRQAAAGHPITEEPWARPR